MRTPCVAMLLLACGCASDPTDTVTRPAPLLKEVQLSSLDLSHVEQAWGSPGKDTSVDGHPLSIGGRTFATGLGSHATGSVRIELNDSVLRFKAMVGIDDEMAGAPGSVIFSVLADAREVFRSPVMRAGDNPQEIDIDLRGVKTLILQMDETEDGQNFDHADWAESRFIMLDGGEAPRIIGRPREPEYVLTPAPAPEPRITGPSVFGVTEGRPFLFTVTAPGERPIRFEAEGLPPGLSLDAATGQITGRTQVVGEHEATVHASNVRGRTSRRLRIVVSTR